MAKEIHFVEKAVEFENLRCVDAAKDEWETGYWVVGDKTAQSLIGGQVFVHRGQNEPSHKGGTIISAYHQKGTDAKRKVFRFRASKAAEGKITPRQGWGNEKKIVW